MLGRADRFTPAFGAVGTAFALQGILVFSGVVLARALGPEGRGYFALLALIPSVICQIGGLGLGLGLSYYVSKKHLSSRAIRSLMTRPVLIQVTVLSLVHALCLVLLLATSRRISSSLVC